MAVNPSNKYGSLVDSFAAYDMYNLPMPALPPADLTINAGGIISTYMSFRNSSGSRVVDFNPNDNPYIRGLGLTSNLADGLVDGATSHQGGATAWRVIIRPLRFSADLTGTITTIAGSALITGNGTLFTQELAVGSIITWSDNNNVQRQGTVLTVNADAGAGALTLTAALPAVSATVMGTAIASAQPANQLVGQGGYAGPSVSIAFLTMNTLYPFAFFAAQAPLVYSPQGRITTVAGSAAVTGVGTKFLTEMDQNTSGDSFVVVTTDAGDLFAQPTGIQLVNGASLIITALTTTTGPVVGTTYYVVGAGATTFQISATVGGAAVVLTNDGSATLTLRGAGYVIGWTDNLGVRRTGVVASITSETALTLTAVVVANGSGTSVSMIDLDASLRIRAEMPATFFAYTITIDPAFGNGVRRLSLSVFAEIEHTMTMIGSL